MNNKRIEKINYLSKWGEDGTHYDQTIKITFQLAKAFNYYVNKVKEEIEEKQKKTHIISSEDMKILSCLQHLSLNESNYCTLTTLEHFKRFYLQYVYEPPKRDKNFERILHRNTIISII